jgi:hypothetical protein
VTGASGDVSLINHGGIGVTQDNDGIGARGRPPREEPLRG